MCLYFSSASARAEQVTSGTCGDNTTWSFDESTGTLTISGSGRMNAYEQWERPWKHLNEVVTRVVVKGTVDHIGDSSFNRLFNVTEIIIEEGAGICKLKRSDHLFFRQCAELSSGEL